MRYTSAIEAVLGDFMTVDGLVEIHLCCLSHMLNAMNVVCYCLFSINNLTHINLCQFADEMNREFLPCNSPKDTKFKNCGKMPK